MAVTQVSLSLSFLQMIAKVTCNICYETAFDLSICQHQLPYSSVKTSHNRKPYQLSRPEGGRVGLFLRLVLRESTIIIPSTTLAAQVQGLVS